MQIILNHQEVIILQNISREGSDLLTPQHKQFETISLLCSAGLLKKHLTHPCSINYDITITELGQEVLQKHLPISFNKQIEHYYEL